MQGVANNGHQPTAIPTSCISTMWLKNYNLDNMDLIPQNDLSSYNFLLVFNLE